jgi:putative transposase
LGLLLTVVVHAASLQDRVAAKFVLWNLIGMFTRLVVIFADGGYTGTLIEFAQRWGNWAVQIVKRNDEASGFKVLPKRWIVERTFAWIGRCRRNSKDYEQLCDSGESMVYIAMISLMLRRLKPA